MFVFLKGEGGVLVLVKASCIDSTTPPEAVFVSELKMRDERAKPSEQLTLGTHAIHLSRLESQHADLPDQNLSSETIASWLGNICAHKPSRTAGERKRGRESWS